MIRVLLQYDDTYFVQAFSNYASANCHTIEFVCFSVPEKAVEYLSSSPLRFDAVLATQTLLDQISQPRVARLLTGERTVFSNPDAIQINIYQSGPAIISDIKSAMVLTGNPVFSDADGHAVRVVASYSTQGGSGKTTLSYALAAAAARQGKQAMYVNLEPFPALGQLYNHSFNSSIDDLLFAIKSRRDLAPIVLDTMERNQDNVMVLPPFNFAGDLLSLSQEELKALVQVLVEKTDLEYVFIDLPVGFQPMNLWALELCSCVLLVYSDDPVGREHMNRTERDVYMKNMPIQGALLTVLNKSKQKQSEDGIGAKIPYSESMFKGHLVADVQERNPAFLKSCYDLLDKIN